MARTSTVWYWKARKKYYTTIDGRQIPLSAKKSEANEMFHKLMAEGPQEIKSDSVAAILDDFLSWTKENRALMTFKGYLGFCLSFTAHSYEADGKPPLVVGQMSVSQLNASHVTHWLNTKPSWNSTTKAGAITAIQRGLNWAVSNRGLTFNPIKGMEKPKRLRRTTVVATDDFRWLLRQYRKGDPFRYLLICSWDVGCRPQEIKSLTADQMDFAKGRAIISEEDGAKGGFTRAIYFPTKRSMVILRHLAQSFPSGPLFRNTRGNPWTAYAVNNRFQKLKKKTGRAFHHYALRHSYITNKLRSGVDSHVVAALSGHRDTKMIDQVYSHIADDVDFMMKEARKGT